MNINTSLRGVVSLHSKKQSSSSVEFSVIWCYLRGSVESTKHVREHILQKNSESTQAREMINLMDRCRTLQGLLCSTSQSFEEHLSRISYHPAMNTQYQQHHLARRRRWHRMATHSADRKIQLLSAYRCPPYCKRLYTMTILEDQIQTSYMINGSSMVGIV